MVQLDVKKKWGINGIDLEQRHAGRVMTAGVHFFLRVGVNKSTRMNAACALSMMARQGGYGRQWTGRSNFNQTHVIVPSREVATVNHFCCDAFDEPFVEAVWRVGRVARNCTPVSLPRQPPQRGRPLRMVEHGGGQRCECSALLVQHQ